MVAIPTRSSVLRRLRHRIGPALDSLLETVGRPTTRVYPAGYVGTARHSVAAVEATLADDGFAWDPLSVYHYTIDGNVTDGSWVYRSSLFADRQLHVVLFEVGAGATEIYAHEEYNWARHPIKHAREVDIRRTRGSRELRDWLDASDLTYERETRPSRTVRHAVQRVRTRLGGAVGALVGISTQ